MSGKSFIRNRGWTGNLLNLLESFFFQYTCEHLSLDFIVQKQLDMVLRYYLTDQLPSHVFCLKTALSAIYSFIIYGTYFIRFLRLFSQSGGKAQGSTIS